MTFTMTPLVRLLGDKNKGTKLFFFLPTLNFQWTWATKQWERGKLKPEGKGHCCSYLATKRAESEGIKEAALTDFTGVGDSFARPRLRPLIQENNSSTVDNVGLDSTDVQMLLNLIHPNHIMV